MRRRPEVEIEILVGLGRERGRHVDLEVFGARQRGAQSDAQREAAAGREAADSRVDPGEVLAQALEDALLVQVEQPLLDDVGRIGRQRLRTLGPLLLQQFGTRLLAERVSRGEPDAHRGGDKQAKHRNVEILSQARGSWAGARR